MSFLLSGMRIYIYPLYSIKMCCWRGSRRACHTKHPSFLHFSVCSNTLSTLYKISMCGVMVSTRNCESFYPSSTLGELWLFNFFIFYVMNRTMKWSYDNLLLIYYILIILYYYYTNKGDDSVFEHTEKCKKDGCLVWQAASPPATEGGWENRLSLNYRGDLCLVAVS
jgi:hypothetical protein